MNPKDDKKQSINANLTSPLPYEMIMPSPPMAQPTQPIQYPMPQTPQPQEQPQSQSQQAKKKITTGQLMLIIIGILIFVEFPPPIDLIGLGLIVYSLKKYWGKK